MLSCLGREGGGSPGFHVNGNSNALGGVKAGRLHAAFARQLWNIPYPSENIKNAFM